MGSAAVKSVGRPVEIRIRFEPGLGAALYASLREGEVGPLTVSRMLGRGKALLHYHGVTLMAHGAPEWKPGETFSVVVKELGPPLILTPAGARESQNGAARVTIVDSAVVPSSAQNEAPRARD
jgi:hypothetical protein